MINAFSAAPAVTNRIGSPSYWWRDEVSFASRRWALQGFERRIIVGSDIRLKRLSNNAITRTPDTAGPIEVVYSTSWPMEFHPSAVKDIVRKTGGFALRAEWNSAFVPISRKSN
jgi:hypothetical protein